MSGILGKKLGMTRLIKDDGRVIPITVITCEPNEITQVKTVKKDGYPAIVLGFAKLKHQTKTKKFRHVREFKVQESELASFEKGKQITVDILKDITEVKVTAITKGKGFQGVMKRYNFHGGPASHGSHFHREPGSIGTRAKPGRVEHGKKLPGHMGDAQMTLKNIKVELLDEKKNIVCLRGPIPGGNGTLIMINTHQS